MTELVQRASEIEDFTGRTLEGRALRFERPSRVSDDQWRSSYFEEYAERSAAKTLSNRDAWPLHRQHKGDPLGEVAFAVSDGERALMFTAHVARGPEGDGLLEDVQSGEWGDVSMGAYILRSVVRPAPFGQVLRRTEIRLDELSVAMTGSGLMSGAEIQTVRASGEEQEAGTDLSVVRRKLVLL